MRILQSGRKKWLTIKTKITKTEKIKNNQAAVKDKAAADRADNPVHKVDRVVLVPEEVPVLVVQVDNPAPEEEAVLEVVARVEEVVLEDPVVQVAALVQAEAVEVPEATGKIDKLFLNINKGDSRRIAFVFCKT